MFHETEGWDIGILHKHVRQHDNSLNCEGPESVYFFPMREAVSRGVSREPTRREPQGRERGRLSPARYHACPAVRFARTELSSHSPTATLECIAKICPCKMAVLHGSATRDMHV